MFIVRELDRQTVKLVAIMMLIIVTPMLKLTGILVVLKMMGPVADQTIQMLIGPVLSLYNITLILQLKILNTPIKIG